MTDHLANIQIPATLAASIAHVCHEANRAWQIESGDPVVSEPWDRAPIGQRISAIEGVAYALAGATPEEIHDSWCKFKTEGGWVHGEVKDEMARTHPCLVPYNELPAEQRAKDALFIAIVTALRGYEAL